jgi:hypothetical protein
MTSVPKFHALKAGASLTGFFFTDGPYWVEQRRFTLRHLRDLGFGKKSLEGIILDEAEVLIKKLQYNEIQVKLTFDVACSNRYQKKS